MPRVSYRTTIAAPLADVWAWHEDVRGALPALTPPGQRVELVDAAPLPPRVGTVVRLRTKVPVLGWQEWVARYAEHRPPEGGAAWFVDVQDVGPFRAWRHQHRMEAGGGGTVLTDEIDYTPPLGPLGWVGDKVLIRRQLDAMFAHRHKVTRDALGA